jgi:hypothetical protein
MKYWFEQAYRVLQFQSVITIITINNFNNSCNTKFTSHSLNCKEYSVSSETVFSTEMYVKSEINKCE